MDSLFYYILLIIQSSGKMLFSIWPYILVGVILGELLKYTPLTRLILTCLSKPLILSVLFAVVLGMVSPLCTYGTIPIVLQLFRFGVPLSPLVAFLASSSMMNPQLFIYTWGGINPEMALVRTASVLVFGLLVGFIVHKMPESWIINPNIKRLKDTKNHHCQITPKDFHWKVFSKECFKTLEFISYYFLIGIAIGSIIEVLVPQRLILSLFKPGYWTSVLLASILGVPLYACGGGTIPLVNSMMKEGMSKGSALAFLVTGSATRVTPLMSITAVLRPIFLCGYITLLIAFSLFIGIIYR